MSGRRDHYDSNGKYIGHSDTPEYTRCNSPTTDKAFDKVIGKKVSNTRLRAAIVLVIGFVIGYSKSNGNFMMGLVGAGVLGFVSFWAIVIFTAIFGTIEGSMRGD